MQKKEKNIQKFKILIKNINKCITEHLSRCNKTISFWSRGKT